MTNDNGSTSDARAKVTGKAEATNISVLCYGNKLAVDRTFAVTSSSATRVFP